MSDKMQLNKKFLERHQKITEEGKKEYQEIYERMIGKLNSSHIEPLAKILLEKDGCNFSCASSIESIKEPLLSELLEAWNKHFWEPIAVDKLADIEMLKDHFAGQMDTKWQIKTKTPTERILPLRMHYKKKRLEILKADIAHQSKILEEKCANAVKRRNTLQRIEEECFQLDEGITNQLNQHDQEEKILQEFKCLLREEDSDIFTAKPKVRTEF